MATSDVSARAGSGEPGGLYIRQTSGLVRELGIPAAVGISLASVAVVNTFINFNAGYVADEMFNALRGSRRLLFHDPANGRHLDVFIGEFSMCHDIPMTTRLAREPLTVPREELLLSKLQIVELTANDQSDVYNLIFHNDVSDGDAGGISAAFIATLCAGDWGLWRTCQLNIERSLDNLGNAALEPVERELVAGRLERLRARMEAEPKTMKWRIRNQVGDRVRWYAEPEEEPAGV